MRQKSFLFSFYMLAMVSCTAPSYYEKTYDFNKSISTGHFDLAEKMIEDDKDKYENSKVRFLYFVNGGLVEHLKGNFEKNKTGTIGERFDAMSPEKKRSVIKALKDKGVTMEEIQKRFGG